MKKNDLVNFIFEASALKRLQRTGWQILGENKESIAEHSFMVGIISFVLAKQLKADLEKVLLMSLLHDFTESRIGDIYKLADFYVKADVMSAANDAFSDLLIEDEAIRMTKEYEAEKTLEAKIVHDADTLALMIELKQLMEKGNINAEEWFLGNVDALRLDVSKKLARELKNSNSQDWWKREREKI
ncbi:HD domain-containing protein, partial [Candidatus Gottesmanbacteria bacterium]|nr:HD domain-containing protein [Candidatus Gottesmanbacteria bacterium]